MTVATIYADTSDGKVRSSDATYSTARSGANLTVTDTTATSTVVGQEYAGGTTWYIHEYHLRFDTSSIGSASTVSSTSINIYSIDTPGTWYVKDSGWTSGSLSTSQWMSGSSFASATTLASGTVGSTPGYLSMTGTSALTNHANMKTGVIGTAFEVSYFIDNSASNWYGSIYTANNSTNKPYLSVTYTPAVTGTAAASLSGTFTASGTRTTFGASSAPLTCSATATGTPTVVGQAASNLGAVTASIAGTVTVVGTCAGTLGSLTATAVGAPVESGTAAGGLGNLTGTATGLRTVSGTADGSLGTVSGTATGFMTQIGFAHAGISSSFTAIGTVVKSGAGASDLTVASTATGIVTVVGVADGSLGGLTSTLDGTVNGQIYGHAVATLSLSAHGVGAREQFGRAALAVAFLAHALQLETQTAGIVASDRTDSFSGTRTTSETMVSAGYRART